MVQALNPSNDVELTIYTTEPAWAVDEITTGEVWKTLKFLRRDLRLGNLQAKYDDFEWLENQLQNTQNLLSLRNGKLSPLAPVSLIRVIAPVELSHSRGGFLRRWFRTYNINSNEENEKKTSIWGKVFK